MNLINKILFNNIKIYHYRKARFKEVSFVRLIKPEKRSLAPFYPILLSLF